MPLAWPESSPRARSVGDVELVVAVLFLCGLVALVVVRPLLAREPEEALEAPERAELEAAKEAKYREIRDAQLDLEMGKLSEADQLAIDRELRAEAIEILRRLDALEGRAPDG